MAHPNQLPTFRRFLIGLLLMLVGLDMLNSSRISTLSLASIVSIVIVLLPLPSWILSPFTVIQKHKGAEEAGKDVTVEHLETGESSPNLRSLSVLGLILIGGWLLVSQYFHPWLMGLSLAIGCGVMVRRFLLEIEWKLAANSVLAAIAQSDTHTPDQLIEQITRLLYEYNQADAAIALRQLDQVTAQSLVSFPPTALPDKLTTPKLFAEALTYNRILFYENYPATPKAAPVLVAQGTQSLAILPLRKEQTTQEQGAILLLWYHPTHLPSYQHRFLELLLGELNTLLRLHITTFRLEQLQARYNAILEIPQGVVFVDISGGQGWLNPAGATLLGLKPGEVEPSAIAQAMTALRSSADNQPEIAKQAAQLFSQPDAEIHDWIWTFSQPQSLVLSLSSFLTYGKDIQGRLWLFNDITDKYLAQQVLAERTTQLETANEQLETVNDALRFTQFSIDRAADAIFWIGQDGTLLYVNYAACRLLGYPLHDLLSMTIHEIDANFTAQSWLDHWQIIKQCGSLSLESYHRCKTGKSIPVDVQISYLEFNGQEYNCAFVRDITERKRAEKALRWEQEKADRLLLNILPQPIAERLKQETCLIADRFADVTILFADIVGFTDLSARMPPTQLVFLLNQIFSRFDQLTEKYGLEKIKTIGDAYMIASGIPTPRHDHAEAMIEMALDMQDAIDRFNRFQNESFCLRIGINSGPVVAGVIGTKKFIYDLWGDAVNTASRMESHGIPDKIQVTETTYNLCKDKFLFEPRGGILVKGKGEMTTYILVSRK